VQASIVNADAILLELRELQLARCSTSFLLRVTPSPFGSSVNSAS